MSVYQAGLKSAVDTGDTYFREIEKLPIAGSMVARQKLVERPQLAQKPAYNGPPLEARIEYARWIVDCPNCGNAEFAFEDKLFMCSMCFNSDAGGQVRSVQMPSQRPKIEAILSKRKIVNRHWENETIAELQAENTQFGIGE